MKADDVETVIGLCDWQGVFAPPFFGGDGGQKWRNMTACLSKAPRSWQAIPHAKFRQGPVEHGITTSNTARGKASHDFSL